MGIARRTSRCIQPGTFRSFCKCTSDDVCEAGASCINSFCQCKHGTTSDGNCKTPQPTPQPPTPQPTPQPTPEPTQACRDQTCGDNLWPVRGAEDETDLSKCCETPRFGRCIQYKTKKLCGRAWKWWGVKKRRAKNLWENGNPCKWEEGTCSPVTCQGYQCPEGQINNPVFRQWGKKKNQQLSVRNCCKA